MPSWYQCRIKYTDPVDGNPIQSTYLVDAVSFTDAETKLFEKLDDVIKDFSVEAIQKKSIADVFDYTQYEEWYQVKMEFKSVDENTGKEKAIKNTVVCTAKNCKQAYDHVMANYINSLVPYEIVSVALTDIVQVYPYQLKVFPPTPEKELAHP